MKSSPRATRQASDSKFAMARTTRPSRRTTRAISAIAASGCSKWSIAPLQIAASKLASAKGSCSDQAWTQAGRGDGERAFAARPAEHAAGGLHSHHPRAAAREYLGVLAEAARQVEKALARPRLCQRESPLRHAIKQVLGIARGPRRDHVAQVSIELVDAHGAGI